MTKSMTTSWRRYQPLDDGDHDLIGGDEDTELLLGGNTQGSAEERVAAERGDPHTRSMQNDEAQRTPGFNLSHKLNSHTPAR